MFLPIHAAGLYQSAFNAVCLSEFCVVSYAPTINALLDSNRAPAPSSRSKAKLLLATASAPFVMSPLPSVDKEAKLIIETVPTGSLVSPIPVNTAEDVLRLLPEATILHLACHGQQNAVHPLESGFIMQDKMIKVADLIRLNLPRARLAFLSACETAQGDVGRPDEALHLAATMLYAGFKSVVGTMWSMDDIDGPVVAETLYSALFDGDGDGDIDFDVVPYALDAAVQKLRARSLGVSRWASYVHIGM
jgi:CHAT domain-containing protein